MPVARSAIFLAPSSRAISRRLAGAPRALLLLSFRPARLLPGTHLAFSSHALPQRVHQVDDIARLFTFGGRLDWLTPSLAADQLLERRLVFIPEPGRIEMPGLGLEDVRRQRHHIPRHLPPRD